MNMELSMYDIEEIERNYEALTKWLIDHLESFNACAFTLNAIVKAVNEAKEQLNDN